VELHLTAPTPSPRSGQRDSGRPWSEVSSDVKRRPLWRWLRHFCLSPFSACPAIASAAFKMERGRRSARRLSDTSAPRNTTPDLRMLETGSWLSQTRALSSGRRLAGGLGRSKAAQFQWLKWIRLLINSGRGSRCTIVHGRWTRKLKSDGHVGRCFAALARR